MSKDGVGERARALAHHECDLILQGLSDREQLHEAVHSARKAVRRLRALLALLEESDLDPTRPDRTLQQLGDSLSHIRDAHVVSETAERLQRDHPALAWKPVLDALLLRRDAIMRSALESDPEFAARRTRLSKVDAWVTTQAWEALKPSMIKSGIAYSERRVRKAAKRAANKDDPESIHRWRRRVRRLRMQREALPELGLSASEDGKSQSASTKGLHKLSDRLGWQQDLRMVRNLVRPMPVWEGKPAILRLLDAQIRKAAVDAGKHPSEF
jgi:CHAD domain-containing protein